MSRRIYPISIFIVVLALLLGLASIAAAQDIPPGDLTQFAGTPGLDETAPPPTDGTAVPPPVTINLEFDPGDFPDVQNDTFSWKDAILLGVLIVVASLLRTSVKELARSVPGHMLLTGLANVKDQIPGTIDDTALKVGLWAGNYKLVQRPDGAWDVVPKDSPPASAG